MKLGSFHHDGPLVPVSALVSSGMSGGAAPSCKGKCWTVEEREMLIIKGDVVRWREGLRE